MIEILEKSKGPAFGFSVHGLLTAADTQELTTHLDEMIGDYKKPIGLLADLSHMEGANWGARWDEMRFLQRHTDQIARLAIVGVSDWEDITSTILVASAALQAQTLYFLPNEISHAWHWVKMVKQEVTMPVRIIHPGHGLFHDYTPEYVGI